MPEKKEGEGGIPAEKEKEITTGGTFKLRELHLRGLDLLLQLRAGDLLSSGPPSQCRCITFNLCGGAMLWQSNRYLRVSSKPNACAMQSFVSSRALRAPYSSVGLRAQPLRVAARPPWQSARSCSQSASDCAKF